MPGMYLAGAVYNNYLSKLMDKPSDELRREVNGWESSSRMRRLGRCLAHLLAEDFECRIDAARDILAAREDPDGGIARKINPKIDAYRAERNAR